MPEDSPDVQTSETARLARLFADDERWGWEYHLPAPPRQSATRQHQPQRIPIGPPRYLPAGPASRANPLRTPAIEALAAWLAVLFLDFGVFHLGSTGSSNGSGSASDAGILVVHFLAMGAAFYFAFKWTSLSPRLQGNTLLHLLIAAATAVVTLLAPYLTLAVIGALLLYASRNNAAGRLIDPEWQRRAQQADEEFTSQWQQWRERIVAFEASDRERYEKEDIWYPVAPTHRPTLSCLFGGSAASWQLFLATVGPSILASGRRLAVVNLSRRHATAMLEEDFVSQYGKPPEGLSLPRDYERIHLFRGLDFDALTTLIVEVLHSAKADADLSRRERQADLAVLRDVASKLDPEVSVSVARLRAGLRAILSEPTGSGTLSEKEFDDLSTLYGEVQVKYGDLIPRVVRLEHELRALEFFTPTRTSNESPSPRTGSLAPLEIIEVSDQAEQLASEIATDLLFQLLLRTLRMNENAPDVIVIVGADHIRRQALDALHDFAERDRVRLFFLFEHLRDDAVQVLGAAGSAAGFMQLANPQEAAAACEFIGRGHKWIGSQYTRTVGRTINDTWGHQTGASSGPTPMQSGTTVADSFNRSIADQDSEAVSTQRVYELVLEPSVIQGLPTSAMIVVEIVAHGQRVLKNVDFNPRIATFSRVAQQALPNAVQTS